MSRGGTCWEGNPAVSTGKSHSSQCGRACSGPPPRPAPVLLHNLSQTGQPTHSSPLQPARARPHSVGHEGPFFRLARASWGGLGLRGSLGRGGGVEGGAVTEHGAPRRSRTKKCREQSTAEPISEQAQSCQTSPPPPESPVPRLSPPTGREVPTPCHVDLPASRMRRPAAVSVPGSPLANRPWTPNSEGVPLASPSARPTPGLGTNRVFTEAGLGQPLPLAPLPRGPVCPPPPRPASWTENQKPPTFSA